MNIINETKLINRFCLSYWENETVLRHNCFATCCFGQNAIRLPGFKLNLRFGKKFVQFALDAKAILMLLAINDKST